MYSKSDIQKAYDEAARLNEEFKSLDKTWSGKEGAEGYADAAAQMDRLIAESQAKLQTARRYEQSNTLEAVQTTPDPAKGLPLAGSDAGDADGEDTRADHLKAFDAYLRYGAHTPREQRAHLKRWNDRGGTKAAINETTAGEGGYLVPTEYDKQIVVDLTYGSILRPLATVRQMRTNSMKIPTLTHTSRAVKHIEKPTSIDEAEPTFGEIAVTPFKYMRKVLASADVLEDAEVNLWTDVIQPDITYAFVLAENEDFTRGTGGSPQTDPEGVITGASTGVTTASPTVITNEEWIDFFYSLSELHRPMGTFMIADGIAQVLRKVKFPDGNQDFIWVPGFGAGRPDTLFGRPVVYNYQMDATQTANSIVALFGNFKYFHIFDRVGLAIRQLNELYAETDQVGWIARRRYTSKVMLAAAIKKMVMHS